jgi:CheY-like chemotaxis protein
MTGSNRKLSLLLVLAAFGAPAALAQDITSDFKQAVDMMARDHKDEALVAMRKVVAANPTPEQAYELWKSADPQFWLDMMKEQGEYEQLAKRFAALVATARREHKNDAEAIKALVGKLDTDDVVQRRAAVRELSANHGEYAVPAILPALADSGNEDRRIRMIQSLSEMNTDVVVPLIEALDSDDAFLRRNVAMTLGRIGDARAVGALEWMAANDADGAAQAAAREALGRMRGSGDACRDLCALGESYHLRRGEALADYMYSDVVWSWDSGHLTASPTPRALYPDAMAVRTFARALKADPSCADAAAGIARANASQIASVEAAQLAGQDVAALQPYADHASIVMRAAGNAALDSALGRSCEQNDVGTAIVLARALSESAPQVTGGIETALHSRDGAIASEATVAIGRMAAAGRGKVFPDQVTALGQIAGREIARIAFVIDADSARAEAVAGALSAQGMMVTVASSGSKGLSMLQRVPGLDVVVLADKLPDITPAQVIDEIRGDASMTKAPILILSSDPATAEAYAGTTQGVLTNPTDIAPVTAALAASLNTDRARADMLSAHAAEVLAQLAAAGTDIRSTASDLANAVGSRPDSVTIPAARALGAAGGSDQVAALTAVLADNARSEAARAACGNALAQLFGRGAGHTPEAVKALHDVAHSDAPISVRQAAASAIGNLPLSTAERAALLAAASTGGTHEAAAHKE